MERSVLRNKERLSVVLVDGCSCLIGVCLPFGRSSKRGGTTLHGSTVGTKYPRDTILPSHLTTFHSDSFIGDESPIILSDDNTSDKAKSLTGLVIYKVIWPSQF
jgi:hypothetical protein